MSRIQNILEKAERDGGLRRMNAPTATSAAVAENPIAFSAPTMLDLGAVAPAMPPPQPIAAPARVVSNVRLHPTLVLSASHAQVAAEQYRALRTRMFHTDNGAGVNIVLITSPGRGDGKSLTVANLGLSMAQELQRRICIVDADLRHPQQHKLFGLPDGPGLADVLSEQASLQEALITIEDYQITVLPAGTMSVHPAELLGTMAMRRTLDQLRSRFDCVLIDAPAALPLADVGILTPLVDSVVMIVRAGVTSKPAIHDAMASINNGKLLGIVLNEVAPV